jgi:hypothetical protein
MPTLAAGHGSIDMQNHGKAMDLIVAYNMYKEYTEGGHGPSQAEPRAQGAVTFFKID